MQASTLAQELNIIIHIQFFINTKKMELAPVVIFAYHRVFHFQKTLEALEKNDLANQSMVYIFLDKSDKNIAIKNIINNKKWSFKTLELIEREKNIGLADNIIDGVTKIIQKYKKIIVLEDDLLTSPYFLTYMNDALVFYADNPKIMHISGYTYPLNIAIKEDTFFYNVPSSWGWATWERAWNYFEEDIEKRWKSLSKQQQFHFDIEGSNVYLSQIEMNLNNQRKTWAVRWYLSIFLANGYVLYPKVSLVQNIGFDNSGESKVTVNQYFIPKLAQKIEIKSIPLQQNLKFRKKLNYFYKYGGVSSIFFWRYYYYRYSNFIKKILKK
ncbi:MAG: sugar transferase [Cytophagales bacterium]|nr:MAG: sugar transferase [Cytophagales bacterium]